ncbi:unnamed protein product [Amaranthus hypochondriacus]
MSNSKVLIRLHSLFSSTPKPINSIKALPPTQYLNPTKTTFLPSENNQFVHNSIKDLLNQNTSRKMVQIFKSLTGNSYFRERHSRIYEIVIHRLFLAKELSLIEDVLESQKDYISNEGFGARLVYLYGKAGMFDHARKVFDELVQRGDMHRILLFDTLLGAAHNAGEFDKVYQLFQELPSKLGIKPSEVAYSTAVHALCKLGWFDDALELFDRMEENGINPRVYSFNSLLCGIYENGKFEEGDKIWERMIKNGVVPNTISYNSKLHRLFNDGKVSEAMGLFMEMKSNGLKLTVCTYNALILGSCKSDDLDGVRKWYKELGNSSGVPNRVTFGIIVPFLCDKRDFDLAYQVCRVMVKRICLLDEALLQRVVDELVKNSMVEKAQVIVGLSKSNSFVPYNLVLPNP